MCGIKHCIAWGLFIYDLDKLSKKSSSSSDSSDDDGN